MNEQLRILIVDDVPADVEREVRALECSSRRVAHRLVEAEGDFREALRDFQPDLILSDFSMPRFDGMRALALARDLAPDVPFIFVSGTNGEQSAIRALGKGATGYVMKNNLVRLPEIVERALQDVQSRVRRGKIEPKLHKRHGYSQVLLDTAPDAIILVDSAGGIALANAESERLFGYRREELLGMPVDMIVPDFQRYARVSPESSHVTSPRTRETAATAGLLGQRNDGSLIPVDVRLRPVVLDNETHIIGIVRDVTERREQELKVARLTRMHTVLREIHSAIVRIRDRQQLYAEACRIAVEHGGFEIAWIGTTDPQTRDVTPVAHAGLPANESLADFLSWTSVDHTPGRGFVGQAIRERMPIFESDLSKEPSAGKRRKTATVRDCQSRIALPLLVDDGVVGVMVLYAGERTDWDQEKVKLLTELAADVSFALQLIARQEKLEFLSYYDALTGLPNRQLFIDRLSQQMRARGGEQRMVALILFDLERFRNINDTLGRHGGDELLRLIARRIEDAFNGKDYLAHIGADSFGAVIRGKRDAAEIAHAVEGQVLACFRAPFAVDGKELRAAPRAGVALFPADGSDADTLFKNAEAALKKAKSSGERYLFYAPQMNAAVAETLTLENKLRQALEREQFVLHYQPTLDLAKGTISGLEALIRWNDPETGLVPPLKFIPLLEETGMIIETGRWAMQQAVSDYQKWRAQGVQPPRIAVNISPIQLRQKHFVDAVRNVIGSGTAEAHGLDLEITESLIMEDIEGSIEKLRAVRDMGVNIAIDDFGTGYSSLSYLAKLPVNALKIDRSFIITMTSSADNMTIISTIISLAHSLNLKVIAEGVDAEEQRTVLRLLKCDEMQGYLFSRPVPADEIETLLAAVRRGAREQGCTA